MKGLKYQYYMSVIYSIKIQLTLYKFSLHFIIKNAIILITVLTQRIYIKIELFFNKFFKFN